MDYFKHISYAVALLGIGAMANCNACYYLSIRDKRSREEFLSTPAGEKYLDRKERLAKELFENSKTTETLSSDHASMIVNVSLDELLE
jgi:hypothetical protein